MLLAARLSFVVVLTVTIQTTWMADHGPFGVTGDLLLLLAIASGISGGPVRGAAVGFVTGMAIDLVQFTPLGLSALTYLAVGYAVGVLHAGVLRAAPWIPVVAAFVATAAGIILFVLLGQLLGQHFRQPYLPRIVLVTSLINAVLIHPALFVTNWVERAAPDRLVRAVR